MTPTTEQKLADAIRNLELAYALAKRLDKIEDLPPVVMVAVAELKHLTAPYAIEHLGR